MAWLAWGSGAPSEINNRAGSGADASASSRPRPTPLDLALVLLRDVLQQVDTTVRVTPLVVVPADELEELRVQLHRGARVVDAGARVVDEVARDDLVIGVAEDALEVGLARALHGGVDVLDARRLLGLEG